MTTLWVIRSGNALHPADDESVVEFASIPFGKPMKAELTQPRHGGRHRFFWKLCHQIGKAVGAPAANIADILKIETGYCEIVRSKKYGELRLPKSISYAAMSETDFAVFVEDCIRAIYENWAIVRADIMPAVNEMLAPKTERHG